MNIYSLLMDGRRQAQVESIKQKLLQLTSGQAEHRHRSLGYYQKHLKIFICFSKQMLNP